MPYAQLLFVHVSLSKPRTIWYNTESRCKHSHTGMNSEAAASSWRSFSPAHRCYYCHTSVRPYPKHKQRTGNNDNNLLLLHYPLPFHRHCSSRVVFASTLSLQAANQKKIFSGMCVAHIQRTLQPTAPPAMAIFNSKVFFFHIPRVPFYGKHVESTRLFFCPLQSFFGQTKSAKRGKRNSSQTQQKKTVTLSTAPKTQVIINHFKMWATYQPQWYR
ncbi:unnamed protein product [Ectocarpus sp. 12 AP-2014]